MIQRVISKSIAVLRLDELAPLTAFCVFSLCAWGFVELAGAVDGGGTAGIDRALLLALRNPTDSSLPLGPAWLQEAMRDFTALGGTAVLSLVTLVAVLYLTMAGRRRDALFVIGSVVGGLLLSTLLKHGFDRPRPDLVPHGSYVYTSSFPSGHSMLSALTYLTCGVLFARAQTMRRMRAFAIIGAIALTFLVGVSRVYLGVHWPSDVLAGWCLGAGWTALCIYIALHWWGRVGNKR